MPLYVSDKQIVLPGGDAVATRDYNVSGSIYWDGDVAYSAVVGLINIRGGERDVEVIPLSGIYKPRVGGDIVIGYVVDIGLTGWVIDIKSPYSAYLPVQEATLKPIDLTAVDLKNLLGIGDIVLARIIDFNLTKDYPVTLTLKETRLGRIEGGTLVEIDASKVARVIGRRGSMVSIFSEELNCDVTVGQNGRVWIRCRDPGG
ncbi:exosome complex RNA-binding protein Rrp4 [Vulcanisaeta distributa]|uniref:exosome complex RNA-binding protein Rrp4 n=1 Tax=Vulcanisaeta distributa TaxID=164451 RepID=UPI000AB16EB3|nr:exosome complex RNA-binding protein Rrp4 [Vulcanisaeta distributa]